MGEPLRIGSEDEEPASYQVQDPQTGLNFYRSVSGVNGEISEDAASKRDFDDQVNAAKCRTRARWLMVMADYGIEPRMASEREALVDASKRGYRMNGYDPEKADSVVHPQEEYIRLFAGSLEAIAKKLDERRK